MRVTTGQIREEFRQAAGSTTDPSTGWAQWSLSLATIRDVNSDEFKADIVVVSGEREQYAYEGVDLSFAYAGRRHFLGAMPERGDVCVIGWAVQESTGVASARNPIILSWMQPPPWMGYEWLTYQGYGPGEGMDTLRERNQLLGVAHRTRYKLRPMSPGNIVASSSQGSDLVLDESVLLSNRRGNELKIRDQDQAILLRSLQQYHATAGARVYSGMVHREANLLPSAMFSDGIWWDSPRQMRDGEPIHQRDLPADPYGRDYLTPGQIFQRLNPLGPSPYESETQEIQPSLDPFDFLRWGSYVDNNGNRSFTGRNDFVYGGKALYRVGLSPDVPQVPTEVVNGVDTKSLTEYRIEVAHTSDGTLPVTEQTDGFDADRLPNRILSESDPLLYSSTVPFVEFVLGSVIGNNPYSPREKLQYGVPLKPVVFSPSGVPTPGLVSALGSSIGEHAATLLRVRPPVGSGNESFVSFTKNASLRASFAGSAPWSTEIAAQHGIKVNAGGVFSLTAAGLDLNIGQGRSGVGLNLASPGGSVRVYGGGRDTQGAAASEANANAESPSRSATSLTLEGREGTTVRGGTRVVLEAPTVEIRNSSSVLVRSQSSLELTTGETLSLSANTLNSNVSGQAIYQYSGPRTANPQNLPLRRTTFSGTPLTGHTGGDTDVYLMEMGNRKETLRLGNHTTTVTLGNLTYETEAGTWTCRASTNKIEVDTSSGIKNTVAVGDHVVEVSTGQIRHVANTSVLIQALTGGVTVRALQGITLAAPSPAGVAGDIMCGFDRDPLTGIRFDLLGMIPRLQKLGV